MQPPELSKKSLCDRTPHGTGGLAPARRPRPWLAVAAERGEHRALIMPLPRRWGAGKRALRPSLAPGGLAPDRRKRDMGHRRLRLGPVPMPLARLDLHHVPHLDLALLVFGRDIASARSHDQELVAIMRMPSSITSLTKMHHTTVIIGGVPGGILSLPRPGHPACPPRRRLGGAFHGKNRDIFEGHDAHTMSPAVLRVDVSASRASARTVPQMLPTRKPHTPSQA